MAHFKILLALFLFANCIQYSSAAEDDVDAEVTSSPSSASDYWENKECTVVNAKAPKYYLYMKGFYKEGLVAYKKFKEPNKSAKWIINPVQREGNTYFEMKNLDENTFIAPNREKTENTVTGYFDSFTRFGKIKTLWKFDPPEQGVEISIENLKKNMFMNEPNNASCSTNVQLSKNKETAWMIKCEKI